jgi:NTP pyrophosphatase (non-canonical NTP hydrolase)
MSTSRIADTPVTADDVDEALAYITEVMRFKMLKNLHKGHWLDLKITAPYLIARLREEFVELQEAIAKMNESWEAFPDAAQAEAVACECADVANFAMMLADYFRICSFCLDYKHTGRHAMECVNGPGKKVS